MITPSNQLVARRAEAHSWPRIHLSLRPTWVSFSLGLIVLLAAVLRLYNIQSVGNANEYYTAAVKSMLQSFSNFFFAAAEPGGSVTVDKPALGLWLQAISAMILGVSGVAVVLPQIIAGILSVPVLFHLVRRYFGPTAGLIAAFALAVTPVSIAAERNNTMDATLIFTLLLAAWAFIKATDTGKLRYLLLGALLVGLGFNIKMLQAFLPLPAFFALYLFGAKVGLKRKIKQLALATVVLLTVSFAWAAVVQLTPANDRPYIGSTQTNNIFDLVFGYNGLNRLVGGPSGAVPGPTNGNLPQPPPGAALPLPPAGAQGNFPPPQNGSTGGPGGPNGGGFNIGQAGVLRLVTAPLANEVGWLLPFGLISLGLLVFSVRLKLPLEEKHKAAVLWGGWLLTAAVFFSVAGFFHPYYLSMLAPPLAALVGIGATRLWGMVQRQHRGLALLVIAICGSTLIYQLYTANQYGSFAWLAIPGGIALLAGAVILILRRNPARFAKIGLASLLIAILVVPTAWSAMTTLYADASVGLPEAYSGTTHTMPIGMGPLADTVSNPQLVAYLEANTQDVEYLVAVSSSMQGAPLVLETGGPVLYMGGFSGGDPVVDAMKLAQLVSKHKLRYVLQGGDGAPGSSKSDVTHWLQANCTVVTGASGSSQGLTLYQCAVN